MPASPIGIALAAALVLPWLGRLVAMAWCAESVEALRCDLAEGVIEGRLLVAGKLLELELAMLVAFGL
jgi:hypothetical protein